MQPGRYSLSMQPGSLGALGPAVQLPHSMFIPLSAGIPSWPEGFGGTLNNSRAFLHCATLSPWNDVNEINTHLIDNMSSPQVHELLSADEAANLDENDPTIFPAEFLQSLHPSGMPPHALRLKEGCPLLLIRNLCPKHGLADGTRLLLQVRSRVLQVDILTGSQQGCPHSSHALSCILRCQATLPLQACAVPCCASLHHGHGP